MRDNLFMVQENRPAGQGRGKSSSLVTPLCDNPAVREDDITRRIQRVTEDLRVIQEELGAAAVEEPAGEADHLLDQLLEHDLINDFKSAVDRMRQFLWAYIDAVCKKEGRNVDYTLQAFRMQRVTEMLRILRERVELPQIMQLPEAHSFFEEIQATADTVVGRHYPSDGADADKPAPAPAEASKKPAKPAAS
jgi:hypothetical protein